MTEKHVPSKLSEKMGRIFKFAGAGLYLLALIYSLYNGFEPQPTGDIIVPPTNPYTRLEATSTPFSEQGQIIDNFKKNVREHYNQRMNAINVSSSQP